MSPLSLATAITIKPTGMNTRPPRDESDRLAPAPSRGYLRAYLPGPTLAATIWQMRPQRPL